MNKTDVKPEIVIDDSNFHEYFFDTRRNKPKQGQIMAKFCAVANFVDGPEKRHLIEALINGKAQASAQVLRKIHCVREPDCFRVCREISEDLLKGMSIDEVAKKEYTFVIEAFYYTQKEYVPKGSKHWSTISLMKYDPETKTYKVDIEL